MLRLAFSFLVLFFLLIPNVDAAASDLITEKNNYEKQIEEIDEEMSETEEKEELIKLSREKNKLAAHKRAYEKAIEIKNTPTFKPTMYLYNVDHEGDLQFLSLYQDAAAHYNIDWALLAAVHDMETTFSTHSTMISSAGALGHMQFMPRTWDYYGVDADGDGKADPFSLPDAIFSAAHYLAATGAADGKVKQALWAYNHDTQYGLDVMAKADYYRAKH